MAEFAPNSATFGIPAVAVVRDEIADRGLVNSLHFHTGLHISLGNYSVSSHETKGVRMWKGGPRGLRLPGACPGGPCCRSVMPQMLRRFCRL